MDRRVVGARQRIGNLLGQAKRDPIASDDELKAEIARFLCVLSSGLLEEALRLMLASFAVGKSSPQIASFVSIRLSDFQNPKFEKIMVLLSSFEPSWRDHFERSEMLEIKDAINSIVNNRNQIAHGRPVGISIATFGDYYKHVEAFIEELEILLT